MTTARLLVSAECGSRSFQTHFRHALKNRDKDQINYNEALPRTDNLKYE